MVLFALGLSGLPQLATAKEVSQEFNGLKLNANLEIAEGNDFSSPMVLIVHGLMGHYGMEIIKSSQQVLSDNGHSSLAINLSLGVDDRKGFYQCDMPHRHEQDNALPEIQAWVDWLKQRGTTDIVLLAHSRGANESIVYIAEQGDAAVKNLVLLAPGVDDSKTSFEKRYGSVFDETLTRMVDARQNGRGGELVDGVDFWYCPQASVTPDSFISYYGADSRFRLIKDYFREIPVPALVIFGTRDDVVVSGVEIMKSVADGERVRLYTVDGAGHFFLDFNLDEAIEEMLEFLT
jgi:pimeloyl-ACP methyl ester carboxylesterase